MFLRLLPNLDLRYPSPQEKAELQAYVATLKRRRSALEEVRKIADTVAVEVTDEMHRRYPRVKAYHPHNIEKSKRDVGLLSNIAANCMFLGETDTYDDQFLVWYRTILKSVHLTPGFLRELFEVWEQRLAKHLTEEAWALLRPAAHHMATYLAQIPEPAVPEVGERVRVAV
jgi:hypothetical protein